MTNPIYTHTITIQPKAIDKNGHVNNVHYVQWMQDIATHHYAAMGGMAPTAAIGATWVVRSHQIEYLSPAFLGDEIEIRTWVANLKRVRSLRKYEFIRKSDGKLLVRGETDWVFIEAATGRPLGIPDEIGKLFSLVEDKT